MKKIRYNCYVTDRDIDKIIEQKFPGQICPECGNGVYAGCVERHYDVAKEENIILSFTPFCSKCGAILGVWDNTNRSYFWGK